MTPPAMEAMQATQHVYVVKVRALPDPGLLFPSERRYSSLTVAGLAAGHALLGCVALLLGALALSWDPPQGSWVGHLGAGLWLGAAALQASVCGVLAWRRWYEDHYIVWFFRASLLAAVVAAAGLVLTSAALVHLHENVLSVRPGAVHPADLPPHLSVYEPEQDVHSDAGAADEGSGGGAIGGNPSWLDISDLPLPDANSSTISSGGVFSDLVRDQDHDLVAADSTRHEDREVPDHADAHSGEPEWSVLRWVPVPLSPRTSAQIRSLLAANVLVACFLELLWALLGARLAWRGMRAADADLAQAQAAPPAPHAVAAAAAPLATLAALERGAADGKVDVDTDNSVVSDGELKKACKVADGDKLTSSLRKKKKQQQQQQQLVKSAASLQRRRRAPQLPQLPELHLSLEQRTMNLEERVARLLSPGHCEQPREERQRPDLGDGDGHGDGHGQPCPSPSP